MLEIWKIICTRTSCQNHCLNLLFGCQILLLKFLSGSSIIMFAENKVTNILQLKELFLDIQWKNERARKGEAYKPTNVEHLANIASHGICILPSVYASYLLQQQAVCSVQKMVSLVYGAALIGLFSVSTVFHSVCFCQCRTNFKETLHRCDRAMIYVFIAASYFPWLTLYHHHSGHLLDRRQAIILSMGDLMYGVWILASLGILYQQLFHERYKSLEIVFYVMMGFVPSLPFLNRGDIIGLEESALGGSFYCIGIFFFKSDGRIPCAHAIWHVFVALGAATHYYAVFSYLIGHNIFTERPIGCIADLQGQ
ncbi:monocyte to macrophage differentiation factor-like isoform X1 [Artemia franciscana]|uniref:monocyte to macrophage differentiation factor-like isoform X1 n=2 Tax=Artemia franciscana TaxID=6661 RepID=UPI0032DA1616